MSRKSKDYINNKMFSEAVFEYVKQCNECKENNTEIPMVTDYIALGFKQISEGLARKPNFIGYSYREEMIMDAIENCLKAIKNYNIEAATRSGNPNAFAYFTQISYYAFLRRIAKEKKQQDIKEKFVDVSNSNDLYTSHEYGDEKLLHITQAAVENMRRKLSENEELTDDEWIDTETDLPKRRIKKTNDSDLMEFI